VAVYVHRDLDSWLARLAGARIHRAEALEIYAVERELLAALVAQLERRMEIDLSVADRTLYLTVNGATLTSTLVQHRLAGT